MIEGCVGTLHLKNRLLKRRVWKSLYWRHLDGRLNDHLLRWWTMFHRCEMCVPWLRRLDQCMYGMVQRVIDGVEGLKGKAESGERERQLQHISEILISFGDFESGWLQVKYSVVVKGSSRRIWFVLIFSGLMKCGA